MQMPLSPRPPSNLPGICGDNNKTDWQHRRKSINILPFASHRNCTAAYMPWNRCQVDAMRPLDPEICRCMPGGSASYPHMACTLHPSAVLPADTKKQPVQTLPPHTSPACHTATSTQGGLVASCASLALFPPHGRPRGGRGWRARHHEGRTEVKRDRKREIEREGEEERRRREASEGSAHGHDKYSACFMLHSALPSPTSPPPHLPQPIAVLVAVWLAVTAVCDVHHKPMCRWTPQIDVPQGRPQRRALGLKPADRCC